MCVLHETGDVVEDQIDRTVQAGSADIRFNDAQRPLQRFQPGRFFDESRLETCVR